MDKQKEFPGAGGRVSCFSLSCSGGSRCVSLQDFLARLVSDLQAFLLVLDGENLSYIAQAKKKSISELLSNLQENKDTVVEDAEYMIMNCPSGGPANDLRRNSATDPVSAGNPHLEWLRCPSLAPVVPSQPPYRLEEDEDCYEEAEPFIPANQSTDKLDSESSHYESYGEEDDDVPVDRAHYIQCGSSQPCLRPVPESRLCEYLWRKKWLGQWTRQLFIIKQDSLLCFKCAKDLQPLLEMKLAGCQVVYKSKHSKKMQHELKVVGGSDTLILGFQSCSQAEEWRKTIEELSGSLYCEPESTCSSSILKSERLDSCRSSSVLHTDSDEEILSAPSSALSSTEISSYKDRAGYLNVLMNYQWQTLWCRVDAGVLNLFSDESSEVTPQYTVQLRGSEIRPDTHTHTHRITILQHGDQVAVLEASCPDDKEHWVQLLRDGSSADVVSPNQRNSHESLSGLKTRTLPNANTYMDDPFQQLCGSVRGSPIYCNTASLERMLHKSHPGGNGGSSDSAEYSNCDIFRSNSKKVYEVERGVQKLQLTGKRVQVRAGSEVNLVSLGKKPAKRSSFRQSLLPFCSDRAQGGFLTPLLRRTASAKLSLGRSPSTLFIEHGHVFHRRKEWETKASA
ncbi:actin filament-associated protein 1-like 2 isoform X2 [Hemibagrus wyckioides]|uniref:actin filament-associated protein 1-like 2 isoform X2 n=1 Tax=Hemibagrus wyckioides TaxID=337641 RepID=UPI00266CE116|nr:actin filament-associated protein 1-like 2 isoform X2 [Hemibagrus wyckioides]